MVLSQSLEILFKRHGATGFENIRDVPRRNLQERIAGVFSAVWVRSGRYKGTEGCHSSATGRFDLQVIAGLRADDGTHPRRDTARSVAADLGDGAIGVVEADAAGSRSGI